ncbi:MAG: hypothetical protein U0527_04275 [Candidatus Eisenbacteria bacterium]
MNATLALNLSDLVRHYHTRTSANTAAELLDSWIESGKDAQLGRLLRDHRTDEVDSSAELERREAVDQLLGFYGLVEVAIVAGYVPWPLPQELGDRAKRQLTHPALIKYYREFYPLELPAMLEARLAGWRGPRLRLTKRVEALFLRFLDVSTAIEANDAVDSFLWFLEDGYYGGYGLPDCHKALRSIESYLGHVRVPPTDRDPLDWAVAGVGEYLEFCRELDRLLIESAELPHLQRAMWCHHAYWFQSVAHSLEDELRIVHGLVGRWIRPAKRADVESTRGLRADPALRRLVRGCYEFRKVELRVPLLHGEKSVACVSTPRASATARVRTGGA